MHKKRQRNHLPFFSYLYTIRKRLCVALNNNNNKIKLRPCTTEIRKKRAETRFFSVFFLCVYLYNHLDHHSFFFFLVTKRTKTKIARANWFLLCFPSTFFRTEYLVSFASIKKKVLVNCLCHIVYSNQLSMLVFPTEISRVYLFIYLFIR
jgi:hypothetical protein